MVAGVDGLSGLHVTNHVEEENRNEKENVTTLHPDLVEMTAQDWLTETASSDSATRKLAQVKVMRLTQDG